MLWQHEGEELYIKLTAKTALLDDLDHLRKEKVNSGLVDIVSENETTTLVKTIAEVVDRLADCLGGLIGPFKGVDVGLDDVVAERLHSG